MIGFERKPNPQLDEGKMKFRDKIKTIFHRGQPLPSHFDLQSMTAPPASGDDSTTRLEFDADGNVIQRG